MIYAPVLIPTLCRYKHFIRCVESLKANTWAQYTDIYVALDYPAKEAHWEGYKKICEYLEGDFSEFHSFYVIKRNQNYGTERNRDELEQLVFGTYDRFINTDDDAEFSPNFLQYIDVCLDKYQNDKNIIAVAGYSYPISWRVSEGCNVFRFSGLCPMWGTGFWRDQYLEICDKIKKGYMLNEASHAVKDRRLQRMPDASFVQFAIGVLSKKRDSLMYFPTDLAFSAYLTIANQYVVTPTVSKVRNHGFDGSGEFCQKIEQNSLGKHAFDYDYVHQDIDIENEFDLKPDHLQDDETNIRLLNRFDKKPWKLMMRAKIKILLYKVLGKRYFLTLTKNKENYGC